MPTPIVLTAFGTTTRAMQTYAYMDAIFKAHFPGHDIRWAFTSRMVKHHLRKKRQLKIQHPRQVLEALHQEGHAWAVVQSLHMICGHEFYRLVDDARQAAIRTSMGMPLLATPEDFRRVAGALRPECANPGTEATVWVGHGTDHPAWTTYPAFERHLAKAYGPHVRVGVLEGQPSQAGILQDVMRSGVRQVCLAPLMLVAGVHFEEDLAGEEDSWKTAFEAHGLDVRFRKDGLGLNAIIVRLFCDHIQSALDVIPSCAEGPYGNKQAV